MLLMEDRDDGENLGRGAIVLGDGVVAGVEAESAAS